MAEPGEGGRHVDHNFSDKIRIKWLYERFGIMKFCTTEQQRKFVAFAAAITSMDIYVCHALSVLNFNGVEEIPSKYIFPRWKKDYKCICVPDHVSINADVNDQIQWFNQLYRSALQVVEEGVTSLDHYEVALQAFEESLDRIHDVEEKHE